MNGLSGSPLLLGKIRHIQRFLYVDCGLGTAEAPDTQLPRAFSSPMTIRNSQIYPAFGVLLISLTPFLATAESGKAAASDKLVLPQKMEYLMEDYCWKCHEPGNEKGDVRLDNLTELSVQERLDLFNRMKEQVYFKQMPPEKEDDQPDAEERKMLLTWLSQELDSHNASTLEEKLRLPAYGNAVDHDKLFSGKIKEAAYTSARRWLVSPEIFMQRVVDIFELEGRARYTNFYGVTNPFLLPDGSGVKYYDTGMLDGGHLLVMLTNAEWIAAKQIREAQVKNGEFEASYFPNQKDKWTPRRTPAEFEEIILSKQPATKEQLTAAISKQFQLVLRRDPSEEELEKYLKQASSAIELGGNTEGLRYMLMTVILESEFLYRYEFGEGEPDSHGRRMLSPREGAYAISYALGDRGPDAQLLEAAEQGKLQTVEDYKREVERLLADNEYYRGQIDPGLNGKHLKSHETSHPKLNRFFRDFFGYPMASKVFKDKERSGGYYDNPGRGTLATPGFLIDECDRVVDLLLQEDRNLFERLLTTDEYFVYHNRSNSEGETILREWQEVYEQLKDEPWRTEPQVVLDKHIDFIKARPTMRPLDQKRPGELVNFMLFFDEYFGQGRKPFTTIPWAHGYTFHHSPSYSLPPTPGIGRYGSWKSTKIPKFELEKFWDYPAKQPFKVDNRMGVLTHPAWLIAHSKNTHNDPVVRGKWVREKLLAGRVPDVPITVDAQIPEDHTKTLRTRLESVTLDENCWKCHESMNPLGLPFEIYDDFGRYRLDEPLEHPDNVIGKTKDRFDIYKTLKVDPTGELVGTGNPKLDGEVSDAFDMIERLAKSKRVRQSIIRHAFRFYMGRNELLSDSQTLIDADRAYVESGGSFRAVVVSLLTSDSFIYRK